MRTTQSVRQGIVVIIVQCVLLAGGVLAYKAVSLNHSIAHTEQSSPHQTKLSVQEFRKIAKEFVNTATEKNPAIALAQLRERIKTDDALARSCHDLTHEIGRAAYAKYRDFAGAMQYQDDVCNSGYLHGVIEGHFEKSIGADSGKANVFAAMKTVCMPYPFGKFLSWECYHGVGHGLMYYTENDLPKSLALCDKYPDAFARLTCINGVFMENFNSDPDLHPSRFVKNDDLFYPCPEQTEIHKGDCYLYAPTHYLSLHQNDYAGALAWCLKAENGYQNTCTSGVGSQAIKENINDPGFVEKTCGSGTSAQSSPCITGMVGLYIYHFGSLEPAKIVCGKLENGNNRNACLQTIQENAPLFSQ